METPLDRPQPMTVGNIVTATIELYRARFSDYLWLAGQSVLWWLGPLVMLSLGVALLIAGVGADNLANGTTVNNSDLVGLAVLVMVATFVVGVYCGVRAFVCGVTISRLTFLDLQKTPESRTEAHRFVRRRMWTLFWAACLMVLLVLGIYFAVVTGALMFIGTVAILLVTVTGGNLNNPSPEDAFLIGLTTLLAFLVVVVGFGLLFAWFSARVFVYETAVGIEARVGAGESISVSWGLTRGNAFRLLAVMLITFLVSLPVSVIVQVVASIAQVVLIVGLPVPEEVAQVIGFLISMAIGLVGSLVLWPLWQVVKGIVYYDLKTRKEGIDLQLSDA
ncbi:MAG: hypothetical protein AAGG51_10875 [Cyanobacteria bacterium P01_G01_bin.54]